MNKNNLLCRLEFFFPHQRFWRTIMDMILAHIRNKYGSLCRVPLWTWNYSEYCALTDTQNLMLQCSGQYWYRPYNATTEVEFNQRLSDKWPRHTVKGLLKVNHKEKTTYITLTWIKKTVLHSGLIFSPINRSLRNPFWFSCISLGRTDFKRCAMQDEAVL